jgi:hypothetical protein
MGWAYKQGKEGKDFRATTKAAADAGTIAHALIDADLTGIEIDLKEQFPEATSAIVAKATRAYQNFLKWKQSMTLHVYKTETKYVSEEHQFGGCPDGLGTTIYGKSLLDWKSSKAVYPEYKIQLMGGYGILVDENEPDYHLESYDLIRFDKIQGAFHHYHFDADDPLVLSCKRAFIHLRELDKLRGVITGEE